MKFGFLDLAIIATLVLIIVGTAFTAFTEFVWVGQDLAGIPSLIFLVGAILFGAMLVGRLKRPQGVNLFRLHKRMGVFFAVLIIFAFIHGIWDRIFMGELFFWQHTDPLVTVLHGWLGLSILILAISQVVPSLVIKDRRKIRSTHRVFGYTLLALVIIQILLGVGAVLVELAGG